MTKLTLRNGAVGLGLIALLLSQGVKAADHQDSLVTLGTQQLADINDVYAWMSPDGAKLNLVMTANLADDGKRHLGPGVQYIFHVTSKPGLGVGQADGTETRIICVFASDVSGQCWVGDSPTKDYVIGDPSRIGGVTSFSGKVRMFAARRSDPFFFNLQGFRDGVAAVKAAAGGLTFDAAGCPTNVDAPAVRTKLQEAAQLTATAPCATDHADCFKHLKVIGIALQVDKSLVLDAGHTTVAVWGSTNMGQ